MYILDFFKRTLRVSNIPVIIYLIINVLIIIGATYLFVGDVLLAIVIGLGIYIVSMMITLSPIGEWILRQQTGCKKITRKEYKDYLMPIFEEVYTRARNEDPTISPDVRLFINNSNAMNAFATGRKTICVNKGLMDLPPDEIKGILGHEFGHLAHKDTDLILVISVGNFVITVFLLIMRIFILLINLVFYILGLFFHDFVISLGAVIMHVLEMVFISAISWIWTQLGVLLCMKSSRSNEYLADEFSHKLGYGEELCRALDAISDGEGAEGLFATLLSTHPDTDSRIGRLQELGVDSINPNLVFGGANQGNGQDEPEAKNIPVTPPNILGGVISQGGISQGGIKSNLSNNKEVNVDNELPVKKQVKVEIEIRCIAGELSGAVFPIIQDEQIIIGRDPAQSNIILKNPHISRSHCIIRYFEPNDVFYVTDRSSYGTFYSSGEKLPKGSSVEVKPGSVIRLGDKNEAFQLVSAKK